VTEDIETDRGLIPEEQRTFELSDMNRAWPSFFVLTSLLASLTVWLAPAVAEITLRADFDQASLDTSNSHADGDLITLAGRENFYPDKWKWLYFAASGLAGQRPTFRIDGEFVFGNERLADHSMVYSYDNQTWNFFDNNDVAADGKTFTFSNDAAFGADEVFIAYGLPYPYSMIVKHVAKISSSPWVHPTSSGDEALVIGRSPGGIDDMDREIPGRNIYGYSITDDASKEAKAKVVLVGGVHANESLASYVLEGLVDFLVSDAPEARAVRRQAEFFVYPMVNPDGRRAGYNRSTVQYESGRPNRNWKPPEYGGLDDIRVAGDAMLADVGQAVYVIDFHSDSVGKRGHYAYVLPEWQQHPLWLNFLRLEPKVTTRNAKLIDHTMARFGRDELGAAFSITFETQFIAEEDGHRFRVMGANWGRAFSRVLEQSD
jgi:hypothetical protein